MVRMGLTMIQSVFAMMPSVSAMTTSVFVLRVL